MTSTAATEENNGTSSSGIFGRMRKTTSKKKKTNNVHGRRVVKGTTPPSSEATPQSEINVVTEKVEEALPEKDHVSTGNLLSVQTEALREKTEQWRKDRIDATAAIRKENKEKEVMEHRRKAGGGVGPENGEVDSKSVAESEPVPAILSVESKFPEHKRKAAPDDHSGKKIRVSKSSDTSAIVEEESGDTPNKKFLGWIKIIPGVAAGVVAIAAVFAMRIFRKR